jgi:hypothetical protein
MDFYVCVACKMNRRQRVINLLMTALFVTRLARMGVEVGRVYTSCGLKEEVVKVLQSSTNWNEFFMKFSEKICGSSSLLDIMRLFVEIDWSFQRILSAFNQAKKLSNKVKKLS